MSEPRFSVLHEGDTPAGPDIDGRYGGNGLTWTGLACNFVTSLDGVVTYGIGDGGGFISHRSAADHLLMAMLRAVSDSVVVAASTVRAAPKSVWTPVEMRRDEEAALRGLRQASGRDPAQWAPVVIVSGSGRIEPEHAVWRETGRVVVLTTAAGAERLGPGNAEVVALGDPGATTITTDELTGALAARGWSRILCEGGPVLLGQLLRDGAVDEFFLSIAPQLVGREGAPERRGLIEGLAFAPKEAPWGTVRSVRLAGDLLFCRYGF